MKHTKCSNTVKQSKAERQMSGLKDQFISARLRRNNSRTLGTK